MNQDFKELLAEFNAHDVDYLIVGAHALAAHGIVRATKDMDVWVNPTVENAKRVMRAIVSFGAPLHDLSLNDLATKGIVFQIGVAPARIDILTSISGVTFEEAWPSRIAMSIGELTVPILGREMLVRNKRAAGRPRDLADVAELGDEPG